LIQKVNRPAFLQLIRASKQAENDPGSSQGGALGYEGPPQNPSDDHSAKKENANDINDPQDSSAPSPLSVVHTEKAGMTAVVTDLLQEKQLNDSSTGSRAGLTTRYSGDGAPAKGLLLNKKI
jgi:hypothetical protein